MMLQTCAVRVIIFGSSTTYWSFQNVFVLDFGLFQSSNTVKGVTNSCNLWVIRKLNTYLIFVSGVVVHSVCHY